MNKWQLLFNDFWDRQKRITRRLFFEYKGKYFINLLKISKNLWNTRFSSSFYKFRLNASNLGKVNLLIKKYIGLRPSKNWIHNTVRKRRSQSNTNQTKCCSFRKNRQIFLIRIISRSEWYIKDERNVFYRKIQTNWQNMTISSKSCSENLISLKMNPEQVQIKIDPVIRNYAIFPKNA